MTDKPMLLCDVDGVLNAFAWYWAKVPDINAEELDERLEDIFLANGYTIYVPAGTKERMARITPLFECVWATTWEDKAIEHLSPKLGFGAYWPVVTGFGGRFRSDYGTWKLPAVREWVAANAEGRRVAWLDDDLGPDAFKWAGDRKESTLLVRTDEITGFSDEDADKLEAFALEDSDG